MKNLLNYFFNRNHTEIDKNLKLIFGEYIYFDENTNNFYFTEEKFRLSYTIKAKPKNIENSIQKNSIQENKISIFSYLKRIQSFLRIRKNEGIDVLIKRIENYDKIIFNGKSNDYFQILIKNAEKFLTYKTEIIFKYHEIIENFSRFNKLNKIEQEVQKCESFFIGIQNMRILLHEEKIKQQKYFKNFEVVPFLSFYSLEVFQNLENSHNFQISEFIKNEQEIILKIEEYLNKDKIIIHRNIELQLNNQKLIIQKNIELQLMNVIRFKRISSLDLENIEFFIKCCAKLKEILKFIKK